MILSQSQPEPETGSRLPPPRPSRGPSKSPVGAHPRAGSVTCGVQARNLLVNPQAGAARPLCRHAHPEPTEARQPPREVAHTLAATGGSRSAIAVADGAAPRPDEPRHFRRGPHDLLLLPPAADPREPQGHCVARRPWLLHPHLRALREGGAPPASRPSLVEAVAAAACRRPLATPWRSGRSTFRRSPRRAPYASPTQVKVEKKDEGIEAMRKLMGGAADEDEEEGG